MKKIRHPQYQKLTNFSPSPHLAFSNTYESFTFHNVPHLTAKQLLGNGTQVLIGYAAMVDALEKGRGLGRK